MSHLKEMAKNGYGHWLRSYIPKEEKQIKDYTWEIQELEGRANRLRRMIQIKENKLLKDRSDLVVINTKYADIEPPGESE